MNEHFFENLTVCFAVAASVFAAVGAIVRDGWLLAIALPLAILAVITRFKQLNMRNREGR